MAIALHVTHADTFYKAQNGVGEPPGFFARLFGSEAEIVEDLDRDAVETAISAESMIIGEGKRRTLDASDLGLGEVGPVVLRSDCITLSIKPTHPHLEEAWMAMVQVAIRLADRLDANVWEELTTLRLDPDSRAEVLRQAQGTLSTFAAIGAMHREKRAHRDEP